LTQAPTPFASGTRVSFPPCLRNARLVHFFPSLLLFVFLNLQPIFLFFFPCPVFFAKVQWDVLFEYPNFPHLFLLFLGTLMSIPPEKPCVSPLTRIPVFLFFSLFSFGAPFDALAVFYDFLLSPHQYLG